MQPVLFYAWQSDAPKSVNREFIRDATARALKAILKESEIQDAPRLDHDVKGKSGTPEIAGTIFAKIKSAGFFLGDVTLVGKTGETKRIPNPNVAIELGYAAGVLGWDRILLVMNTHADFGPPQDLPFDLKNRSFPITYSLALGGDKAEVRKGLVRDIQAKIAIAADTEHEATDQIMSQLSMDCIDLLLRVGQGSDFHTTARDENKPKVPTATTVAIDRLLTVGVLRSVYSAEKKRCSYRWTYQGGLVLQKLGFDLDRPSLAKRLTLEEDQKSGRFNSHK